MYDTEGVLFGVLNFFPFTSGPIHLTGTFPRFATVPQTLSPVFRHSSYGYRVAQRNWEVAPAVNWTMLAIANQGMCGEWRCAGGQRVARGRC